MGHPVLDVISALNALWNSYLNRLQWLFIGLCNAFGIWIAEHTRQNQCNDLLDNFLKVKASFLILPPSVIFVFVDFCLC